MRYHATRSAACTRRESTAPATAPLRGRPAIGVTPHPGTLGNAGCDRSCRRSRYGRTPRSRSVRHARRAPPCDSARSHSSPSIARGSHARGWPRARQDRDRGECPRPPELVEPWPAALRHRWQRLLPRTPAARRAQAIEWALDLGNHSDRHATVAGRRLELLVSEQRLNDANVPAAFEQMGREAVAKRMQGDCLAQPRGSRGLLEQPAELTRGQRVMITATWKQPAVFWRDAAVIIHGRPRLPPLPQQLEDLRRQHHVPVLAALRLHDADDLLLTVDVARSQPHHLASPQPATIGQA